MGVPQLTLVVKVYKREACFITNLIAHDFEINIGISHLKALRWSRKHVSACQLRGQDWIVLHCSNLECV